MAERIDEEYSIAFFEDGSKEIIPKAWIQDYLKDDTIMTEAYPTNMTNITNLTTANVPTTSTYVHTPQHAHQVSQAQTHQPNTYAHRQSNYHDYASKNYHHHHQQFNQQNQQQTLHQLETKYSERIILENLVNEVNENKRLIRQLQRSVDRLICIASGEPEPEIDLTRPAGKLDDFLAIEEHIKIRHNYEELVNNLGKIGGKTIESTTRRIWSRLCTTALASTICWTGANGKHCLRLMSLNNLVRDAVLVTHPYGKECDIQKATMLWFSHAQDRLRSKSKKTEHVA